MAERGTGLAGRLLAGLKRIAMRLAEVQVRVLLFCFYFTVFAPFALLMRWVDPLAIRRGAQRGWVALPQREGDESAHARRQS